MTISLWIHGYDKTKKNPQHDQILNSYINIKNISTTGISVSRIVYKKDIDFFLCIFAVNSYSLLKHLISLKKLPFASNALLDKHPCHFRTSEPELGMRQFFSFATTRQHDNVTEPQGPVRDQNKFEK